MRKLHQVGFASAAAIGLMSLSAIGSLTTAGIASAAPKVPNLKLSGYTYAEARVSIPPDAQAATTAVCPSGDVVVGGGGYEVTQGLGQDLNSSYPNSTG